MGTRVPSLPFSVLLPCCTGPRAIREASNERASQIAAEQGPTTTRNRNGAPERLQGVCIYRVAPERAYINLASDNKALQAVGGSGRSSRGGAGGCQF